MTVRTGLVRLAEQKFSLVRGLRVGAICNPTSCDDTFVHLADLLSGAEGVRLAALFGPEHGVRGEAQDMVGVDSELDRRTGVPVYSLYGSSFESLSPAPRALAGLDALLFDVQDVGARYYTFVHTMGLAMQAAARAKIRFLVLDRPNPLGGVQVEGNIVEEKFRSFVGLFPLAVRHGLTVGEAARLFNQQAAMGCDLHVVEMEGWRRSMHWAETGLPWIPPSPNMPTPDTALVYPGMCLVEGTNLSEGRGTTRPFELVGAPFLDGHALAAELQRQELPGVRFRPVRFTPTFHKWAGQSCGGVMVHVTDRRSFLPLRTGVALVAAARRLCEEQFRFRTEPYEFVSDRLAFDLLAGTDGLRLAILRGEDPARIAAAWEADERAFAALRAPHLLYG